MVFVDSQIADYQAIVAAIDPGVKVFVYDGTKDGLAEIAQDLQGVHGLASIDIIDHGAPDVMAVGADVLAPNTISTYSAELAALGNALAHNGQLDLYGCDVAATGDAFIEALQQAVGRNVAASTGPVGATALGGDWTLDATTGPAPDALPANPTALQAFDNDLLTATAPIYVISNATGEFNNGDGGNNGPQPVNTFTIGQTATDSAGDIFMVGTFRGTVDFGLNPSNSLVSLDSNDNNTGSSVFVVKYNSSFVVQWAEELTGTTSSPAGYGFTGSSIAVNAAGTDVVVGGSYIGGTHPSANYPAPIGSDYPGIDALTNYQGQSEGTISITSQNANYDGFVVNLNVSGALQWDAYFLGSGGPVQVALDSTGNVYVAGPYNNEDLVQDPDNTPEETIPANHGNAQFVDSTGSIVISSFPGSESDNNAAIIKLSSAGKLDWSNTIIGLEGNNPSLTALAVDPSGNPYLAGSFFSASFGGTSGPTYTPSGGDGGAFVLEANPSTGAFETVDVFNNTANDDGNGGYAVAVNGIAFDATGPVVTGFFTNGTELVPGVNGIAGSDAKSLFTATYHSTSGFSSTASSQRVFVEQFKSTLASPSSTPVVEGGSTGFAQDQATSITVDATGNIVVGGYIESGPSAFSTYPTSDNAATATFGSTTITYASSTSPEPEGFVWDLTLNGVTLFAGAMPGAGGSDSGSVVGVDTVSGGGVVAVLNIDGKIDPLPSGSAIGNVDGSNNPLQGGAFIPLTAGNLGENVYTAPTVTPGTPSVTFDGGSASTVTLDSGLTVTAGTDATLTSAMVSIAGGYIGGDALNYTPIDGIAIQSNSGGVLRLTGSASVADYQAALDSITFSFSPTNGDPTNGGSDTIRTIDWVVNDGTSNSNTGTSSLHVVHEPPTVSAGATVIFDAGGSAAIVDGALTVGDPDSGGNLAGATVSIGPGFATGDTLNFTAQNGITGSYNPTTGALTLSGAATLAQYTAALDSITFSTTNAVAGNRTIDWSVNDGSASAAATSTVEIHEKPVVTAGATATFDGGGGPVVLDSPLTVTDASSTTLSTATVSIASGYVSGDTLSFTNTSATTEGNITGSYSAGTHALTLTSAGATATLAQWQKALESIAYSFSPVNGDPTNGGADTARTIDWVVNDGTLNSSTATSTLDTVHVAATVMAGGTATFDGGGSAVTLGGGLIVSDVDSGGVLSSATVSIASRFISGDTLSFTDTNPTTEGNIAGSYNAATGVLTLTSTGDTATVAQWQTALEAVAYSFSPTNGDPTGGGGDTTRTIDWVVNDGVASSVTQTSALDTVHVAPTITAGATATFETGGPATTLDSAITLSDVDSGGVLSGATVSIGAGFVSANDALHFTNQNGITGSYNPTTGALTLSGAATLAQYAAALDSITFSTTSATAGARTIDWSVTDGSSSNGAGTATSTINVQVGPDVTAGATATFTGGGAAVTLDGALTVSDIASADLQSATVTIVGAIAGDTLNFTNQHNITGSYSYNSGASTGVLTLSGKDTLADYQAALDSITYSFSPSDGDPTGGGANTSRTIDWSANDGTATSAAVTSTLDVTHVAPSVAAGAIATFEIGSTTPLTLDGGLTVTDVDSGGTLASATVTIEGSAAGDTLNFTNTSATAEGNITGSYNAGTGVLTLTSASPTATLAQWQAALESITFITTGTTATSHTIDWTVADGVASSTPATSTINETLGPQVTAGGTVTYDGGGGPVTLDAGLTLADPFSTTLTGATVTIGGFVAGDTLAINGATSGSIDNGSNGTISYTLSSATGVLTLTGADTVADYQAALRSVVYSSSGDPTNGGVEFSRTVSYTVTDSNSVTSAAATSALDTYAAPTLSGGGDTADFTQGGAAVTLESNFVVTDPNGLTTLSSATASISSDFAVGDTLSVAASLASTGITANYNSADGVLTLSGSSSIANYEAALNSVTFATAAPIPFGSAPTRAISWTVNDEAGGLSNPSLAVTSTVDLLHTDSAPALGNVANTALGAEQTPVVLDGLATVSDAELDSLNNGLGDYNGASLTIARSGAANSHDAFGFQAATDPSNSNTLSLSGNTIQSNGAIIASFTSSGGALTLAFTDSGGETVTTALANTVLENITYTNTGPTPPASVVLDWTFSDGNRGAQGAGGPMTASGTTTVDIATINHAPVATITDSTYSATEGLSLNLKDTGLSVSDVDGEGGSETATLSVGEGVLTVTAGTSGATVTNSGSASVTISGTTAEIDALLNTDATSAVAYVDANATPAASTALTLSIDDNGHTGAGGPLTGAATATIDIHALPTVTAGSTAIYEIGAVTPTTLDPNLTVSDASSTTLASATVSIDSGGFVNGDSLNFINQHNISGSYNSSAGVLTLTGSDTLADYQAALESITFNTTATTGGTRTIDWVVNDATANSAQATSTVDVATGAQITAGGTASYTQGSGAVALDAGVTVSDPGSPTLTGATVKIVNGAGPNDTFLSGDTLAFINQNNITGSYNASTGALTLSGVDTLANYQSALELDQLQLRGQRSDQQRRRRQPDHHLVGHRRRRRFEFGDKHVGHGAGAHPDRARHNAERQHRGL